MLVENLEESRVSRASRTKPNNITPITPITPYSYAPQVSYADLRRISVAQANSPVNAVSPVNKVGTAIEKNPENNYFEKAKLAKNVKERFMQAKPELSQQQKTEGLNAMKQRAINSNNLSRMALGI